MRGAIADYGLGNARKLLYVSALEKALREAGHEIHKHPIGTLPPKGVDFAVFWGMKTAPVPALREARIPFIVSEMPYFGGRQAAASLGWNHLARHALRPPPGTKPRPQPEIKPWKSDNTGKVMVLGQVPRDYAVRNINMTVWANDTIEAARKTWGREVVFRPHPATTRNMGFGFSVPPLHAALAAQHVWLAVTYNSSAAVECAASGIPTVALDDASMAFEVASHSIGERKMPNREQWAHWLSYCQWSHQEFEDGTALAHIMRGYDAAKADAEQY